MGMREFLLGAIAIGGVGGYFLPSAFPSTPTYGPSPSAQSEERKTAISPALVEVPQSEEQTAADSAWSAGQPSPAASDAAGSAQARRLVERSVTYSGCNQVRALGKAPLYAGQPGYRIEMDGDGDGVACEPVRS